MEGSLSEGLVRDELERVLASETFARSESLKRFLKHVVEAKLGGRESELKEQVLGAEVFGRGASYDPRIDPIVRVQATRLRSKLRDYHLAEGARSELVIELPKGSYVPSFAKSQRGEERATGTRRAPHLATGAALALLALLAGFWLWKGRQGPPSPAPRSIAVLPFTDMSPGSDHEYFGDGLAEEITTALASIEGLDVVPRTNAFQFKGENADLATIASALGCQALLQASVRVSDEKLRVQAQPLRAASGRQLWTETYDRPLEDAFAVQEEIARAIFLPHQGRSEEAAAELEKLEELRARGYVPPALLARVHVSRGEEDKALLALEAAEAEHSFSLVFLAVDPDFEPLRPNPRFRALIERLGLVVS